MRYKSDFQANRKRLNSLSVHRPEHDKYISQQKRIKKRSVSLPDLRTRNKWIGVGFSKNRVVTRKLNKLSYLDLF